MQPITLFSAKCKSLLKQRKKPAKLTWTQVRVQGGPRRYRRLQNVHCCSSGHGFLYRLSEAVLQTLAATYHPSTSSLSAFA